MVKGSRARGRYERPAKPGRAAANLLLAVAITFGVVVDAGAEAYDANMSRAASLIGEVEAGIELVADHDVTTYNHLSGKLTKAGELLQASTTKEHPEYVPLVQRWSTAQQHMAAVAERWTTERAEAATAAAAGGAASQSAPPAAAANSAPASAGPPVDANEIRGHYQRDSIPALPEFPTKDDVAVWVGHLQHLRDKVAPADLAAINQAVQSGRMSEVDGRNLHNDVKLRANQLIQDQIRDGRELIERPIREAVDQAWLISETPTDNPVRAYNFAGGDNGRRTTAVLDRGLAALESARYADTVFDGAEKPERQEQLESIRAGRARFAELVALAPEGKRILDKAPRAKPKKRPEILPSLAQKFWLGGRVIGEVDAKGGVWIDSRKVGDIENNGKIWVGGIDKGSLEPDGKVWFQGTHVGTLEDNGRVWVRSRHVGSVDDAGKLWVGSRSGSIEPFQGEWRRAAIVVFFDLFGGG